MSNPGNAGKREAHIHCISGSRGASHLQAVLLSVSRVYSTSGKRKGALKRGRKRDSVTTVTMGILELYDIVWIVPG